MWHHSQGRLWFTKDRQGRLPIDRWVEEDHDEVARIAEEAPVVDKELPRFCDRFLHQININKYHTLYTILGFINQCKCL